jgi:hypothetical protein
MVQIHTVPFSYIPGGIKVQGKPYPLVKMQWVQGESLSAFVGRSIGYPDTLLSLAKVWMQLLSDLKAANIAHGDLQHGNVLVVGDRLRLLDYDGNRLRQAQKQVFGLQWQTAKQEREGMRFASFRFSTYLRNVMKV